MNVRRPDPARTPGWSDRRWDHPWKRQQRRRQNEWFVSKRGVDIGRSAYFSSDRTGIRGVMRVGFGVPTG